MALGSFVQESTMRCVLYRECLIFMVLFAPDPWHSRIVPLRQEQYHTYYAPMDIERWALPLFNSVRLVPKSSKTIARSQIKCASCHDESWYQLKHGLQV